MVRKIAQMENKPSKNIFNLKLLQKQYFKACIDNVTEANEAIKSAQNWFLVLGLAEMSFLGGLFLKGISPSSYMKMILAILLFSFILFLIGTLKQHRHILKSARYYHDLSNKVISVMEKYGNLVSQIPLDLKVDENQINSDRIANIFIGSSFSLILLSTISIIIFILCQ